MDTVPATRSDMAPVLAASEALRLYRSGGVAWLSLLANRVLEEQVRSAHAWGTFLRKQSAAVGELSERARDPVIGEALVLAARIGVHAGEAIVAAAVEWGRRHGHLAFAVPVTGCPDG